jgi:hypothetical protein
MAATARATRNGTASSDGDRIAELQATVAELEAAVTMTLKFAATLAVRLSAMRATGTSATFREIVVNELRAGQHSDVDRIENWLTEHGA